MILDKSIAEISKLLSNKEVSSVDLVKESLAKIKSMDSELKSFISVKEEGELLKQAEDADKNRNSDSSPLHGIPFSLKDAYVTKDIRTTAGSKLLDSFKSPYDATVYKKLKEAGAILIGKNNQDSWGHGASNENTDYGIPKNPWDTGRSPGGSSGGSAVSVSSRMVGFAIGEDTGGSIRNPSGWCNVSGLKVTYGRVSRYGAIAYASSLDTVGPMAKTVEDLSLILNEIAGKDPLDASSSSLEIDNYHSKLNDSLKGKKIGIPMEFLADGIDPEIKSAVQMAAKEFEKMGAEIIDVSIPFIKHAISIYYMISASETSSNLGRYDGIRYGTSRKDFSPETARRIILGTYALSAGYADELYNNAQKARTILIDDYDKAFKKCDVFLGPITPMLPPKIGELSNPLQNMLADLFTATINIVGVPSLAIPAGFSKNNLPIGVQIIGKKFRESEILNFGHKYQQVTDWHTKKPNIK
jgi:aspartyl-tRNA(Asn)/glutamyl-tRNA(Gln) amidotransferase subunit A